MKAKQGKELFSTGRVILGIVLVAHAFLFGCEEDVPMGGVYDPDILQPEWALYPRQSDIYKPVSGSFDFAEGKAVGNPAPTIRYYFNGPGSVEPPELEDNLHSSWLAAGWKYVENPGEPVQNLQGGEYILYGVASSGQHRIRSRPITMRVTSSIAPDVWVSEPVMDESKLDTGAVSIKSGEAAVETQTDAEGNTIATVQADPLPDYRHYYAPYSTDTETGIENAPTPPVDNYDRSWKDGNWTEMMAEEELQLPYGKYHFYSVAVNNGGGIRHDHEAHILGGVPDWPVKPTVNSSGMEMAFTLETGGIAGGYPLASPEDITYYYGSPDAARPQESEYGEVSRWYELGWNLVKVGDTVEEVIPAGEDYQLCGVASNKVGFGIGELTFSVYGLSAFESTPWLAINNGMIKAPVRNHISTTMYIEGPLSTKYSIEWSDFGGPIVDSYIFGEVFLLDNHNYYIAFRYYSEERGYIVGVFNKRLVQGLSGAGDHILYPKHVGNGKFRQHGAASIAKALTFFVLGGETESSGTLVNTITKNKSSLFDRTGGTDMWLLGGNYLEEVKDSPGWHEGRWEPRKGAAGVLHEGTMYLIAGEGENGRFFRDVWKTENDGYNWTKVTDTPPWTARSGAQVVSFNGRIWLMGGIESGTTPKNDIWSSQDGETWRREDVDGELWLPRSGHSLFVMKDRIWLVGGAQGIVDMKDVWYSRDGRQWVRIFETYGDYVFEKPNIYGIGNRILITDTPLYTAIEAQWIEE